MSEEAPLLQVSDLVVVYRNGRRPSHRAVGGVSFDIRPGQTVGLVGESGSGKSSIGRAILGLVQPSGGTMRFQGRPLDRSSIRSRRALARELQVVFQDPNSSLNPARTIGQSLMEPLLVQARSRATRADVHRAVRDVLGNVGLSGDVLGRYPSEFSGGQRQRIAVARALVMSPKLIICDEPVSALDLSVQAQVLNLMVDQQALSGLSYLFISHDLSVVRHISHHVLVLHDGLVVEEGAGDVLAGAPTHPYTRALVESIPEPDPSKRIRVKHE